MLSSSLGTHLTLVSMRAGTHWGRASQISRTAFWLALCILLAVDSGSTEPAFHHRMHLDTARGTMPAAVRASRRVRVQATTTATKYDQQPKPVCMRPEPQRQLDNYHAHILEAASVAADVYARGFGGGEEDWFKVGRVTSSVGGGEAGCEGLYEAVQYQQRSVSVSVPGVLILRARANR